MAALSRRRTPVGQDCGVAAGRNSLVVGTWSRPTIRWLIALDTSPSIGDVRSFMYRLDLELEQARRHDRSFCISRFDVVPDRVSLEALGALIAGGIRLTDHATLLAGQIVVLWTDVDRRHAESGIGRLLEMTDGELRLCDTVEFPHHALTKQALLERLLDDAGRAESIPPTIILPSDGPFERADQMRDSA